MDIMNYVIPAIFAFIVGLILWFIKRDRLSLEYDVAESETFPHEDGYGKYFILSLKNIGNKAVENITFKLELNQGAINSVQFSQSELINIDSQNESLISGTIPLLNPKENFKSTITINNAQNSSKLSIEARGVGVTAEKKKTDSIPEYFQKIAIGVTIAVSISTLFTAWTSLNQSRANKSIKNLDKIQTIAGDIKDSASFFEEKLSNRDKEFELLKKENAEEELKRKQGKPEREQVIFSILNKAGLSSKLPKLISISGEGLPFWKTGLFLMHSYLADTKSSHSYVTALSEISKIDFIAPSSKGFLLYLAGKIEKEEGNANKAIEYFDLCKQETPLMYEHLMAQDPAYDLKAIQSWLINNQTRQ